MKRWMAWVLVLILVLCLTGCFHGKKEETAAFQGRTFSRADLSEETLEWLERYNALSEEEQLAISYIPADLHRLLGYGEDAPAEAE